ncbi:Oil body-associated 1B [Hyphodiscus hymeniophilus]|uniref:Oil body-associated 1B n=1 Tax=Hyphodiscus hymeniophilus TaxID=353542 RepID=A0A9P6VKD6_9HELO|nr:Oil body-associated 1B [Hyphodiscus hymeniophilus]
MTSTTTIGPDFKPLHNVCEFLNALHVYTEDASSGITRFVEANHFCSHVRQNLRQCLIYDSNAKDARLIGVEYMVPKQVYITLDPDEQKLHSHEFEVKSGMLICPKSDGWEVEEWEKAELAAMKEVVGLYGKTWHFWQIDLGHELPLGYPALMNSFTHSDQVDLDEALNRRNKQHLVSHQRKAHARTRIELPAIHMHADPWWKPKSSTALRTVANMY